MSGIEKSILTNFIYVFVSIFLAAYMSFSIYKFNKQPRKLMFQRIMAFCFSMFYPTIFSAFLIWSSFDICCIIFGETTIEKVNSIWYFFGVFIVILIQWALDTLDRDREEVLNSIKNFDPYLGNVYQISYAKRIFSLKTLILASLVFIAVFASFLYVGWKFNIQPLTYIGAASALFYIFIVPRFITGRNYRIHNELYGFVLDEARLEKIVSEFSDNIYCIADKGIRIKLCKWIRRTSIEKINQKIAVVETNYKNIEKWTSK